MGGEPFQGVGLSEGGGERHPLQGALWRLRGWPPTSVPIGARLHVAQHSQTPHILVLHALCDSPKHLHVLCVQGVYVPDMILEHTTQRVLVMEWVEGRRLRRAGKNGEGPSAAELQEDLKLVEIGVQCSLEQVRSCLCPSMSLFCPS